MPRVYTRIGIDERFWPKIQKTETCWVWTGHLNSQGYPKMSFPDQTVGYAHRYSWELANGHRIPPGMFVCHSCDRPACVNPDHLFLGTAKDNTRDMVTKGRARSGGQHQFSSEEIASIKHDYSTGAYSHRSLAAKMNCDHRTIGRIVKGESYQMKPYKEYVFPKLQPTISIQEVNHC